MCTCPSPGPSRQIEALNAGVWIVLSLLVLCTDLAYQMPYFAYITTHLVAWNWWTPQAAAGIVLTFALAQALALWKGDCRGRVGTAYPFLALWMSLFGFHLLYTHMIERAVLCGGITIELVYIVTSLSLHLDEKIQWRGKDARVADPAT